MTISWATNTTEITDAIRGAIGRPTNWYVVASNEICPVCGLDPVTGNALDSFCITCSGIGRIFTYSGVTISGHITWAYQDQVSWETGGQLFDGDVRIQIKYTEENEDVVDTCIWVVADGKKLEVNKKILRGVPTINRILVDLIESEKEG